MSILRIILLLSLFATLVNGAPMTFLQDPVKSASTTFTLSDGTPIPSGPGLICADTTGGVCSLDEDISIGDRRSLSFLVPVLTVSGVSTSIAYYLTHRHRGTSLSVIVNASGSNNPNLPGAAVPEHVFPATILILLIALLSKLRECAKSRRAGIPHA